MSATTSNSRQTAIVAACSALAGAAFTAGVLSFLSRRKANKDNVYESQRSLSEYLLFHFGTADELLQWSFGPRDSLTFPVDLATRGLEFCTRRGFTPKRALDIGACSSVTTCTPRRTVNP